MALKAQRELELKVHEEFHKNVYTLTMCYPPPKEFLEVFKKDMFIKNNKAGFHQVVYYLLGLLDAEKLKQKVPTWPPYDIRLENQFRNEVMKYINELNTIYEDANIPQIATSHLISPGGFKFVKFMFKLSQVVLYEQLKRNPEFGADILLPVKPSKPDFVTNENLEKLQIMTNKGYEEINQMKNDFQGRFETAKLEAQGIVQKQQENNKRFKENQIKLKALKKRLGSEFPDFNNEQETRLALEKKLQTLKEIKESFDKCEALGSFLSSSNAKLEHNKQLVIPASISHVVHFDGNNIDLVSLIEGCNMLVDRKRLEIKPMNDHELSKQIERFGVLNDKFISINEDMEQIRVELVKLSEKLQKESMENSATQNKKIFRTLQLKKLQENDSDGSSSTALAEPLPLSPSSNIESNFLFDECFQKNILL